MRILPLIVVAALSACSRPAPEQPGAPPSSPAVAACNDVAPDPARLIRVQDSAAGAGPAVELRGGRIAPGNYDLASAVRIGEATGWSGERAVALRVEESEAGVVLNWAGAAPGGAVDTWTAVLTDTPQVRIAFTCGRVGEVDAALSAQPDTLELRIQDGASGALHMVFQRRS